MGASDIPTRVDQISADWLTDALRSRGRLGNGRVRSVKRTVIGEGEGFVGAVARLELDFDGSPDDVPSTLIVKIPTPIEANRAMGELMGAYYREIQFYETFGDSVPVRVPRYHFGIFDDDPSRDGVDKLIHYLDYLPAFCGRFLWIIGKRAALKKGLRYALLIEDLEPARPGDQVAGASPDACVPVLEAAAKLHAQFWNEPTLTEHRWLTDHDLNPRMRHGMFLKASKPFLERFSDLRDAGLDDMVAWLRRNGIKLVRALHRDAPTTLIHCDLRLDNVFFGHSDPDAAVVLADWQLTGRGAGGYDVAYLLSGALDLSTTPDEVETLLGAYHRALVQCGVAEYDLAAVRRDYQRSLLVVLQMLSNSDAMDMGDDRGVELMDLWTRRAFNLARHVRTEDLL